MLDLEKEYYSDKVKVIAGTDEAGRGPLAGPLVVGAVIFPKGYKNDEINDSKQLTVKKREELFEIVKRDALAYSIKIISVEDIDKLNILNADKKGMKEALLELNPQPDLVLTDAVPLLNLPFPAVPIIKGDAKALCIAASSILAKVTRDHLMMELDKQYPEYGFAKHKGYGTKKHIEAIEKYGPIEGVHRKTFEPVKEYFSDQIKLF